MLRVNSLSPDEVRELFRVRGALEGLAVAEIISSAKRESAVPSLREALSRTPGEDEDMATRVEADLGFHLLLCRLSGNSMLVEAWRNLEGRIRVAIMNAASGEAPAMMSPARHAPIIDAIDNGDVSEAVAVVREHMDAAAEHLARTR